MSGKVVRRGSGRKVLRAGAEASERPYVQQKDPAIVGPVFAVANNRNSVKRLRVPLFAACPSEFHSILYISLK